MTNIIVGGLPMGAKHYLKLFLKICLPLLVLLLAVLLLPKLVRFFMPFILGYIVAFLANPLVTWLQRRISMKRKHSSIFITKTSLVRTLLFSIGSTAYFLRQSMCLAHPIPFPVSIILSIYISA